MSDASTGEGVVLVHGLAGEPEHLDPLAADLRDNGCTVSTPSLPDGPAEGWVEAVEEAGLALRQCRRVHLVGLSVGGLLAVLAARRTGAATITTINAPVVVRDPTLYVRPASRRMSVVGEPTAVPFRTGLELLRVMARAHVAAPRLRRPALVVQGKADDVVHPVSATLLAGRLGPHSRILWLPRAGHASFSPPDTARLVAAVLDEMRRAR